MRKPSYATCEHKDTDHPAHSRSLINGSVVRCLGSIIPLVSTSEIIKPLPSFCDCVDSFVSTLVANPEYRFFRDEAETL